MSISHYLLVDKIDIEGANAISSPLTYGFPAISGFMGAVHALNRKLVDAKINVELSGVLIACHDIQVQCYRPHRYADYTFNQSRNPIKKDGKTAAIIEEGKAHLCVSLVIEISTSRSVPNELEDAPKEFEELCKQLLLQQRMAGGSVHNIKQVQLFNDASASDIRKRLLPAFVLLDAKSELIEITHNLQKDNPAATPLDALLDVATLHHEPVEQETGKVHWQTRSEKTGRGWLVPIPLGFQTIAPQFSAGELENCRSSQYPSQYVETIYSLGKWVFPNRLEPAYFENYFWRYSQSDNLYLFTQTPDNYQGE